MGIRVPFLVACPALALVAPVAGIRPAVARDGRWSPAYSKYRLEEGRKKYGVYVVRPLYRENPEVRELVFRDPRGGRLSAADADLDNLSRLNRAEARELLRVAYRFAWQRTNDAGYFTPETGPGLLRDLRSILRGRNAVVLITEWNNPGNIYQMLSVSQDSPRGLVCETRLRNRGPGQEIGDIARPPDQWRWLPEIRYLREGPTRARLAPAEGIGHFHRTRMGRYWYSGGVVELKTFIRGHSSPEDFVPLILQLVVAHGLMRWSDRPIPPTVDRTLPDEEITAYYQWTGEPLVVRGPDFWEWWHQNDMPFLLAPKLVPFVRNVDVIVEAPSEALKNMYVEQFGFENPPLYEISDPDLNRVVVPGRRRRPRKTFVLRNTVAHMEDVTSLKLRETRPGGQIITRGNLYLDGGLGESRAPTCAELLSPDEAWSQAYVDRLEPRKEELIARARARIVEIEMKRLGITNYEDWARHHLGRYE